MSADASSRRKSAAEIGVPLALGIGAGLIAWDRHKSKRRQQLKDQSYRENRSERERSQHGRHKSTLHLSVPALENWERRSENAAEFEVATARRQSLNRPGQSRPSSVDVLWSDIRIERSNSKNFVTGRTRDEQAVPQIETFRSTVGSYDSEPTSYRRRSHDSKTGTSFYERYQPDASEIESEWDSQSASEPGISRRSSAESIRIQNFGEEEAEKDDYGYGYGGVRLQNNYEYTNLPSHHHIRLLYLHPSRDTSAPIHCTLRTVDLFKLDSSYEAVSYVWGVLEDTKIIYCHRHFPNEEGYRYEGAKTIEVTPNLHAALQRFRLSTGFRPLWVDAISINQNFVKEKQYQLPLMPDIYGKAKNVLIWLGRGDHFSQCLEFFKAFAMGYSHPISGEPLTDNQSDIDLKDADASIKNCLEAVFGTQEFDPLVRFFDRVNTPWFTRRWIIQEVVASKDAYLFYGSGPPLRWMDFADVVGVLLRHPSRIDRTALSTVHTMDALRPQGRLPSLPILDLLVEFSASNCEYGKDRIRALLGLADKLHTTPVFQWAEQETTGNFYRLFAEYCLRGFYWHLDVLHCGAAFQPEHGQARKTRLSWVPDWRLVPLYHPLLNIPQFQAGILGSFQKQNVQSQDGMLQIHGIVFDYVRTRSPSHGFGPKPPVESMHNLLPKWLPPIHPQEQCYPGFYQTLHGPDPEPYWRAFARTIVADAVLATPFLTRMKDKSRDTYSRDANRRDKSIAGFLELASYSPSLAEIVRPGDRKRIPSPPKDGKFNYSIEAREYAQLVQKTMCGVKGRCFFTTDEPRYMGIGPEHMKAGDVIAVFYGARTPFVLRKVRKRRQKCYKLIGDCYIHGIMNGEALEMRHLHDETVFDIT
jgi:hypothetical protein